MKTPRRADFLQRKGPRRASWRDYKILHIATHGHLEGVAGESPGTATVGEAARLLVSLKAKEDEQRIAEAKAKAAADLRRKELENVVRLVVQVVLTCAITVCCLIVILNSASSKEHLGIAAGVLGAVIAYWFKPIS